VWVSRTIRIDDEVYAKLQSLAEPFVDTPNSALRRLLGLGDEGGQGSDGHGQRRDQSLAPLLGDGRLRAGQRLVWRRRNLRQEHRAIVLETGALRLDDGTVHATPSGAATAIAGSQQNGWKVWMTDDGMPLMDLR
jgi:Restriction Enzyme Adenine Methylase Associated